MSNGIDSWSKERTSIETIIQRNDSEDDLEIFTIIYMHSKQRSKECIKVRLAKNDQTYRYFQIWKHQFQSSHHQYIDQFSNGSAKLEELMSNINTD